MGEEPVQKELPRAKPISTSRSVPIRASEPSSIVQLGGSPAWTETLTAAVRDAFPGAQLKEYSRYEDMISAGSGSAANGSLLVWSAPDPAALAQVQSELDESGLPRWAIVVTGGTSDGAKTDFIDVAQNPSSSAFVVAQVLRSAWERHVLLKDNQRLRGTLLTFGSRIAHDLRTPLGGILTTTEMLREVLAEDAPADVPLTQPILDSTDGLVKLIERSSFFARANGSQEPLRVLDMGGPFWSAYQRLERVMLNARMSLKHPAAWPTVSGHENWLELIWNILLSNAVQHSTPGTQLEAGWSAVEGGRRFWVRSEGRVPPEKRASLFFPFHRLSEAGAPRGLGLPVMRGLVELQGGSCGFQDAPAGRIDFFFELPALSDRGTSSGLPRSTP